MQGVGKQFYLRRCSLLASAAFRELSSVARPPTVPYSLYICDVGRQCRHIDDYSLSQSERKSLLKREHLGNAGGGPLSGFWIQKRVIKSGRLLLYLTIVSQGFPSSLKKSRYRGIRAINYRNPSPKPFCLEIYRVA